MSESITTLHRMARPKLLVRAARAGLASYDRARDLARILGGPVPASPAATLAALIEDEASVDDRRRTADATYDIGRHIELLVALMAEARLLPRPAEGA